LFTDSFLDNDIDGSNRAFDNPMLQNRPLSDGMIRQRVGDSPPVEGVMSAAPDKAGVAHWLEYSSIDPGDRKLQFCPALM
jgi:hypothetical protein